MQLTNQTKQTESSDLVVSKQQSHQKYWQWTSLGLFIVIVFILTFNVNLKIEPRFQTKKEVVAADQPIDESVKLQDKVLPAEGVILPLSWGDLGKKMIEAGVIDENKFVALYANQGGLTQNEAKLLYESNNNQIKINNQNSGFILNLLWAFGLANSNPILKDGPMTDPRYGGDAGQFASTGGWTLAKGQAMDHYNQHAWINLTPEQQTLVEKVSQNIYRPCCGNSTYFPDCNHGMAMLGLLELLAAQNFSESQMYQVALQINSYWFPQTYLTIAKFFDERGLDWSKVNPKEVLGSAYSSSQGYRQILSEVEPVQSQGGGGCSV